MTQQLTKTLNVFLMLLLIGLLLTACSSLMTSKPNAPGSGGEAEQEDGEFQEVIVTGSRVGRGHDSLSKRASQRSRAETETVTVTANILPGSVGLYADEADVFSGGAIGADEEVWIISKPSSVDENQIEDETPGTGSMMANLTITPNPEAPDVIEIEEKPLPLKHSDVKAEIYGYISTVDVVQKFHNPFSEKIEAVYLFPLPEKSAVNEFVMTIGERKIRGILREKEEAEQLYNEAKSQGYQASLMVQHRPNIFEQKVANIEPGHEIDVEIRYFHTLSYSDGWYSFVFPTVVGPRFNPPGFEDPVLALPSSSTDTQPENGAGIRYLKPGERSGHDISISVDIHAGVSIEDMKASHPIVGSPLSESSSSVTLANHAVIPNKDFVLSYKVAGDRIKSNLLTHQDAETGQGYFTLMIYPPDDLKNLQRQAMEMVFVLDASGSMAGEPMDQAKAAILRALDRLTASDTFQIIRFSDHASHFGPEPVLATDENLKAAKQYVRGINGTGGTMMINGVRQALDFPHDPNRFRVVTFLTDGYIGNDREIIGEVRKRIGASRIFSFGVGSSVNRFLMERMASEGRGAASFLSLEDSAADVMDLYFNRISYPGMTDLDIDWGSMKVDEVYPRRKPDLFVGKPVIFTGKFTGNPSEVNVSGRAGTRALELNVASNGTLEEQAAALPGVWARRKIADLSDQQNWDDNPELAQVILNTALEYRLMSDYTSFVAVDASQQTAGTHGTTVHQAVPVPEGVKYETTVGE
ncbi:MAG: VIT and VWA domain-containing protein [Pseudomonadota bacterium]